MQGQRVQDLMTPSPRTIEASASVADAAQIMQADDIGDVIVVESERVRGIVTDRDIVVRVVAEGLDPTTTRVDAAYTAGIATVSLADSIEDAMQMMRDLAVRRLPVVEGGRAVGILSLGDLAMERDPQSTLAEISAAPSND